MTPEPPPSDTEDSVGSEIVRDWAQASLAIDLLCVDPAGLGGLHLRARCGPVRDAAEARLAAVRLPRRRLHPAISDEALFGGIDLTATLATGAVETRGGLLAKPALLVLAMAERTPPDLAARLTQSLDTGTGHALVLLDEGAEPHEVAPHCLTDRLAFHADLSHISRHVIRTCAPADDDTLQAARDRLARIKLPQDTAAALVALAVRFGIDGLRAPLLALRTARAHAALFGRDVAGPEDLAAAAALVFASRATQMPEQPDEDQDPPPPDPPEAEAQDADGPDQQPDGPPQDMLVDAVAALLPPEVFQALAGAPAPTARTMTGSGAGARRRGNRRGRPLPPRPGKLDGSTRIDLVATLRAAAPWQTIRRSARPGHTGLHIHPGDIRVKRFEDRSDRLLIFTVDASGSAAMSRLAEAKGAVELLLAEAYARRDHVSLIAFRGSGADTLLPPTRSLVQTKRRLAGLPGGGGTPLAAGLRAGLDAALLARSKGLMPTVALLTDGRGNVALDGSPGRTQAGRDAVDMARALRAASIPALVLDTAVRPQAALRALAADMGAPYMPLPRADARRLSAAIGTALET